LNSKNLPIVIFGAGTVGQAVLYSCEEKNIEVEYLCDNSSNKVGNKILDVDVLSYVEINLKYKDAFFIIAVADIKDVVQQLEGSGYFNWISSSPLLKGFDFLSKKYPATTEFVDFAVTACLLCQEGYINPDKLFLRSVDLIITEKCSLKCKDCSNLSQYYENPKNSNLDSTLKSIDDFCEVIDEINEFRLIGGEPFMNKDIYTYINKLSQKSNVGRVTIYTNGTILPNPNKIDSLKNDKLLFIVTDYGDLSKHTDKLERLLQQNKIDYYRSPVQGWTECSIFYPYNRKDAELKKIFNRCCAKNLFTISDGKFFRCPFVANGYRLHAIPIDSKDFVLPNKEDIYDYVYNTDRLNACNYCKGRFLDDEIIEPAIQVKEPLEYEKYS